MHCVVCGRFSKDDQYWHCGGRVLFFCKCHIMQGKVEGFLNYGLSFYVQWIPFFPHLMGFLMVHCTGVGKVIALNLREVNIFRLRMVPFFPIWVDGVF